MEMKAVKEEIAEEEDDDVPGKDGNNECLNLMEELEVLLIKASVKHYLCTFYQVCFKKKTKKQYTTSSFRVKKED